MIFEGTKNQFFFGLGLTRAGDNNPPADLLGNICDVLGISASELLGLKLSNDEFNSEERRIIKKYRENKAMQHAVKVLLGIDRL